MYLVYESIFTGKFASTSITFCCSKLLFDFPCAGNYGCSKVVLCLRINWGIGNFSIAEKNDTRFCFVLFTFLCLKCLTTKIDCHVDWMHVCKWKIDCIFAISWQLDTCTSPECSIKFSAGPSMVMQPHTFLINSISLVLQRARAKKNVNDSI